MLPLQVDGRRKREREWWSRCARTAFRRIERSHSNDVVSVRGLAGKTADAASISTPWRRSSHKQVAHIEGRSCKTDTPRKRRSADSRPLTMWREFLAT